jgi:hypothetical protein
MIFYQYDSNRPMPLKTKLGLIFGIVAGLAILAIFAFTFFLIALAGGVILFVINFFRPKQNQAFDIQNEYENKPYKNTSNKDIIDI